MDTKATSFLTQVPEIENDESAKGAVARIQALEAALNTAFIEREDESASAVVALIAEEHMLMLGPPGTGKSAMANAISSAIGGQEFSNLLTKFSAPEEVFGPVSLKGLENDEYKRVTQGYFPQATVAFVDEIFKANSSILNSLLSALNERVFDNGGKREKIPLEVVIGASNELPEDDTLDALYDRFCLRHWVSYIKDRDNRRRLMQMKGAPAIAVRLQAGDLAKLRELREQVIVPEEVEDSLLDICERLAEDIGVLVSDRRLRKSMQLVRANAIRNGRSVAEKGDLMVLANSLWLEPEQAPAVYGVVAECSSPALADALRLLDAATEVFGTLDFNESGGNAVAQLADANREIRKMLTEVQAFQTDAAISGVANKIEAMANQIAREVRSQIGGI